MSQHRTLAYAEDTLGVHKVWVNSEQIVLDLQDLYTTAAGLEAEARDLSTQIDRRKADLLLKETDLNPTMAVTAFERHIKVIQARDEDLTKLIALYNQTMAQRDTITAQIRGRETNHKAHVARMNELAGYFQYLASAKSAQTAVATAVSDWPY